MVLNLVKTEEIVFQRPNPKNIDYPAAMDMIEQLTVAKIARKDNDIELRPAGHDFLLPVCNVVFLICYLLNMRVHLNCLHVKVCL